MKKHGGGIAVLAIALFVLALFPAGPAFSQGLTIEVDQAMGVELPPAYIGYNYTGRLIAVPDVPPIAFPLDWSITAGSLPPGLQLLFFGFDDYVDIAGTPTAEGVFPFTVGVSDSVGGTGTADFVITVDTLFEITTSFLPEARPNVIYYQNIEVAGETPPVTWSISSGTLTGGLTLNTETGEIYGVPTVPGLYQFWVSVLDAESRHADKLYTHRVVEGAGEALWEHVEPDSGSSAAAIDDDDNIYLTGTTHINYFDEVCLTMKLDPAGNTLWSATYGGLDPGGGRCHDVAVDHLGNVFVAGQDWEGSLKVPFVIKYDSAGNELWVWEDDLAGASAKGVVVDESGDIYAAVDGTTGLAFSLVKLDTDGNLLWNQNQNNLGFVNGMDIDSVGNVYVAGSIYQNNTRVVKYDPSGNTLWFTGNTGWSTDGMADVAVGPADEPYVVARGAMFIVVKYDVNGNRLWTNKDYTPSGDAESIAVDSSGNAYVTGYGWNYSDWDYLTVKYGPSGNVLWAERTDISAETSSVSRAIALDNSGNVIVSGSAGAYPADMGTIKYSQSDADGDGYTVSVDCDDFDSAVNPGAVEVCDGLDNNCDGTVDEGFDADGDFFTSCGGDCNDADGDINPLACDIKNDGIDQDCDGADRTKGKPCAGDVTCIPTPGEETQELSCDDGVDNDCDKLIDGADPDCTVVDCSMYGDKASCTENPDCRWRKKQQDCINR